MRMLKISTTKTLVVVATALLSGSVVGTSSSHATPAPTGSVSTMNATALESYKADYAAWLLLSKAWNATRTEQIATHVANRATYSALALSNKVATSAITSLRISAVAAANNVYAAALLKAPTSATKVKLLATRTAAITAATTQASSSLAALPVLGAKPLWPVAAPRPVKPVRPALT